MCPPLKKGLSHNERVRPRNDYIQIIVSILLPYTVYRVRGLTLPETSSLGETSKNYIISSNKHEASMYVYRSFFESLQTYHLSLGPRFLLPI